MLGILTFHRAVNYGAVLQTYALQQTLDELGIVNEVIDYRCQFIERYYNPKPIVSPIHVKHFLREIAQISVKKKLRDQFDSFLEQNIRLSKAIDRQNLCEIAKKYDTILTGSDQVWNLTVTGEDTTYMLDFVPDCVRKISYAASIGPAKISQQYQVKLTSYLKKYDTLSVREPAAKQIVEILSGKNVEVDVDPTVLRSVEQWSALTEKSDLNYKNYIFVYTMQPSDILYDTAQKLAQKEGLKIYSISMVDNPRKLGIDLKGAKIEDFLWLIKHARYVVTNSFHGLLFAIRFHKQFYWAFQQGKFVSNPRFDMLIEQYGIDCRCCYEKQLELPQTMINYQKVDAILKKQRECSVIHLVNSIKGVD